MIVTPKKPKSKRDIAHEARSFLRGAIIALGIALFVTTLIAQPVRVEGSSMMNSLKDKDLMIVTKFDYLLGEPERFDVVICRYPGRGATNFVKRIVGVPGDTVAMYSGMLFVNGELVEEEYIEYRADYFMEEITVEEGHYFVLGDNRCNSSDSHLSSIGQLARDQILGRVRMVVWPLSEARSIR
ncbi:MAG: signal peptidase I [Firmicutes bacterium]|nr:signal peptidase I [Bacillota bacterium]